MLAEPQTVTNCSKCGGQLDGSWTEARGAAYHTNCFICDKCHQPLGNIGIFVRAGVKTYCRPCRTSMLGYTNHNKQLPPQQTQQPLKSNNKNNSYVNRHNNLSKPLPLSKPIQRHSANNIKPIKPLISNTNRKNEPKRYSQPPSIYSTQLKNNIQSFGTLQTANALGNGYNNTYSNNNVNVNNNTFSNNSNNYNQMKHSNNWNNINNDVNNNEIQQQQYNEYNEMKQSETATIPSIPPSEPEPMIQPHMAQMTDDEIDDWNDHSTANKPRDFIGLSQIKKREEAAKNNTYQPKGWNENNNNNVSNNKNVYDKPKKTNKKKFKLFG